MDRSDVQYNFMGTGFIQFVSYRLTGSKQAICSLGKMNSENRLISPFSYNNSFFFL